MKKFKTILWDFDGVILDSMKIKGDGFVELFKNYDEKYLKKLEEYHYTHGGVSRFDKIRYFYNEILGKNVSDKEILKLAGIFADIVEKKLFNQDNLIKDSISFIKANYENFNFHIVSGAEHNELNNLCDYFNLRNYFISIDGSPTKKDILVENIIKKYHYKKEEIILIGDSMTDYNAAINNNIIFYGYNNLELKNLNYIHTMRLFSKDKIKI